MIVRLGTGSENTLNRPEYIVHFSIVLSHFPNQTKKTKTLSRNEPHEKEQNHGNEKTEVKITDNETNNLMSLVSQMSLIYA